MISNSALDKIGERIRLGKMTDDDLLRLDEWRALHVMPMKNMYAKLSKCLTEKHKVEIVYRLKRLDTIIDKLKRQPEMALSRMQDIGGIRIIVHGIEDYFDTVSDVERLMRDHYKGKKKNYIEKPKEDGYRGMHFICKYGAYRKIPLIGKYSKMMIEIQIRTEVQHAWATAVEIVDLMQGEQLKRGTGNKIWNELFRELSYVMMTMEAMGDERAGKIDVDKFVGSTKKIATLEKKLNAIKLFSDYRMSLKIIEDKVRNNSIFVVAIQSTGDAVKIWGYDSARIGDALDKYQELEKDVDYSNRVLISASNITQLKGAYPNYFADTERILSYLTTIVNEVGERQSD